MAEKIELQMLEEDMHNIGIHISRQKHVVSALLNMQLYDFQKIEIEEITRLLLYECKQTNKKFNNLENILNI